MKQQEIQTLFQSFEDAVCMIDDTECWSARSLQELLGYSLWQNFSKVINKAKEACEIKDSLTRAFDELHSGKAHKDARKLFINKVIYFKNLSFLGFIIKKIVTLLTNLKFLLE